MGGKVDKTRLDRLPVFQKGTFTVVDGGISGEVKYDALRLGQRQQECTGVEIQRRSGGVQNTQIDFQGGRHQNIGDGNIQLFQSIGHGDLIFCLGDAFGGAGEALSRGPDVRQVPGAEFQHGFIFQQAVYGLLLAAQIKGKAVEGQPERPMGNG